MTPPRWATVLVLVMLGVGVLWLRFNAAPGELSGEAWKMAAQGDLVSYYLPMTELVAGRLARLELPLWNPHVCSGIPLLATLQVGVFYPGNWLALWLPAHLALSWLMLIECLVAGWLAAWMFRAFGSGEIASATGGVLYVFACVLGQVLWPPAVSTLLFVPWTLLCVQKCLARPQAGMPVGWWCALAIGVALQLLAGFPQYAAYGFCVLAPFAALRLLESWGTTSVKAVALRGAALLAAVATGAGLAGIQLAPTLELLALAARAETMTPTALHYLTIWDPYTADEVVRAAFDASPALVGFHLGNSGGYLGMGTLLLAGVAVAAGWRSRWTWLWATLAGLSLVLSNGMLGGSDLLYRAFAELPVVGSFRTPERLRLVTFLCVIVLAVSGFDRLRGAGEDTKAEAASRLRPTLAVLAVGLVGILFVMGRGASSWRVGAAFALALAVSWSGASLRLRRGAEVGLFTLLVLDLALATATYGSLREIPVELSNRYATADRRSTLPAGFFQEQRDAAGLERIELYRHRPRMATAPSDGGFRVSCYEPLVPRTWPALERVLSNRSGMGATLFDLDANESATFYDVAGVGRVLRSQDGAPRVVWNPDALPRAFVLSGHRVVSQEQAFRALRDGAVDFHRTVLVEQAPGIEAREQGTLVPARIVEYRPERVVVEAESPTPGLLVLSDSHHPGWRATRDGEPVPILRANGLYRAVRLPAGRHRVVFEYVPVSLRIGAGVSLASLGVLLGVAFWRRGRTRREH